MYACVCSGTQGTQELRLKLDLLLSNLFPWSGTFSSFGRDNHPDIFESVSEWCESKGLPFEREDVSEMIEEDTTPARLLFSRKGILIPPWCKTPRSIQRIRRLDYFEDDDDDENGNTIYWTLESKILLI